MASPRKRNVRKRPGRRRNMADSKSNSENAQENVASNLSCKRRILNTYVVIALLLLVVLLGSAIRSLSLIPANVVPDTRNIWNQVFNKWAWLWTLIVTTPNIACEVFTKTTRKLQYLALSFFRVYVFGTASWSFWTNFVMPKVEYATSDFTTNTTDGQPEPIPGTGFDISGHAFLLLLSFLIIQEEVALLILRRFYKLKTNFPFLELQKQISVDGLDEALPVEPVSRQSSQSDVSTGAVDMVVDDGQQTSFLNSTGCVLTSYVIFYTVTILFASFIQLLWIIMVLQTSIFFHTFLETILGSLIAFTMWFIIYKVLNWLILKGISKIQNTPNTTG